MSSFGSRIVNWLTGKFSNKAEKRIAFLDGDQPLPGIINAYNLFLKGTETHLIRLQNSSHAEPKILKKLDSSINKIYLVDYTAGKEVVDKFITAYIQKAIDSKYTHITVVSSDYDFIDTFKMSVMLNPLASHVTFRMIVPKAKGRLSEFESNVVNIEIVKL